MTQNCSILVKIIKTALPINLPVNISMESSHCCKEALKSIVFTTIAMKHLISAPIIPWQTSQGSRLCMVTYDLDSNPPVLKSSPTLTLILPMAAVSFENLILQEKHWAIK
jgi:hypothetical protein